MGVVLTVRRAVIGLVLLLCTVANYHLFLSTDTSAVITTDISTAAEEHQLHKLDDDSIDNRVPMSLSVEVVHANAKNQKGSKQKAGDNTTKVKKQVLRGSGSGSGHTRNAITSSSTTQTFKRSDYRYCAINPPPEVNQSFVLMQQMPRGSMNLWYQCAGKPYHDYIDKLWEQVVKVKYYNNDNKQYQWGKRPTPIPPGKTILVMGNSHTRQVMTSLICQYKDLILNSTQISPVPGRKNVAMKFRLKHDITIYVIVNHPFVYSKRWHLTLSIDILKLSFTKLDAIVLGSFNQLKESFKSTFLNDTLQYQKHVPRHRVNINQQEPPYMDDVAKVYGGNIVWMSMFAKYNQDYHERAVQMISSLRLQNDTSSRPVDHRPIQYHHLTHRNNLRAVYGRKYIDTHMHGVECSSDQSVTVSTCLTNTTVRYHNGHKCVGQHGGFPDLIAWDLIEALYELLVEEKEEK